VSTTLPLVYAGHHTYPPYANNAALTFVVDQPLDVASSGYFQYKFDKDAGGTVNSITNSRAPVSRSGNTVRVGQAPGNYYSFVGTVDKSVYKGKYVNPAGEDCGTFFTDTFVGDIDGAPSVVYAGTHNYAPYANNSPFLLAVRGALQSANQGVLVWSWDKDASGNPNTNTAQRVGITFNSNQVVILGPYYVYHGTLNGNKLEGKFVNPAIEACGTFTLSLL